MAQFHELFKDALPLTDGWWTSKVGPSIDIEHSTPDVVAGGVYGEVVAVLGRTTTAPGGNSPST